MSLKTIIQNFEAELEAKVKAREAAVAASRKAITFSKQAVMALHRDEVQQAGAKFGEAQKMLRVVENVLSSHRDLSLNITQIAYQEYAEAAILLWLIEKKGFPKPGELSVPTIPYLLGLADAIGELRRSALESLRKLQVIQAEHSLHIMNDIYSELVVLETAYLLAPELRRKCDVARRLIEITIGDVATATGRRSLEKSIRQLEKQLKIAQ